MAALLIATAAAAAVIVPRIHADGDLAEVKPLDLGSNSLSARPQSTRALTSMGLDENEDGYQVLPRRQAKVRVPVRLPSPKDGRTLLRVWAYGPENVSTTVALRLPDGSKRVLGRPGQWVGREFDVTKTARGGQVVLLEAQAKNPTGKPALFLDRIAPVTVPASSRTTASEWSVGLLAALLSFALLAIVKRFQHWPLPLILGGAATLLWSDVPSLSAAPLSAEAAPTWNAVRDASWVGFHDGLVWGSWDQLSSLTVQIFHALTPIVGTAPVSARSAGVFAALFAIAAIYAFGNRAAGRLGGVVATGLALLAEPFREAAIAGTSLPVLVLAAALFGYALHACLAEAATPAVLLMAGGVWLLTLAEPTWLPGGVIALVVVALAYGAHGRRRRVLGAGLLALVVLLIPHWASTADQNDGSVFADISARATYARNVEFLESTDHGAPTPREFSRDPFGGRPVSLSGYLFEDHSFSQVIGGVLSGGQEAFSAFAKGPSGPVGVLAFVILLLGSLYLLILPRLRLLALLPPLVAAPTLFMAEKGAVTPFVGGAAMWPALLIAGGILGYAIAELARPAVTRRAAKVEEVLSRPRLPLGLRRRPKGPARP